MSWNTNQSKFLRMAVTKRADGRLDVSYLKDATTAATATAGTLDEAVAWLEMTHGTGRYGVEPLEIFYWFHPESGCLFTTTSDEGDPRHGDPLVEEVTRLEYEHLKSKMAQTDLLEDLI